MERQLNSLLGINIEHQEEFLSIESLALAYKNPESLIPNSRVMFLFDDGEKVIAHSVFLITFSSIFRERFASEWKDKRNIPLKGESSKCFKKLIQYIYTGELKFGLGFKIADILDFLVLAYKIEVHPKLFKLCDKHLKTLVNFDNYYMVHNFIDKFEKHAGIVLDESKEALSVFHRNTRTNYH